MRVRQNGWKSSPNFGMKIPKIFELPPPRFSVWNLLMMVVWFVVLFHQGEPSKYLNKPTFGHLLSYYLIEKGNRVYGHVRHYCPTVPLLSCAKTGFNCCGTICCDSWVMWFFPLGFCIYWRLQDETHRPRWYVVVQSAPLPVISRFLIRLIRVITLLPPIKSGYNPFTKYQQDIPLV